MFYIADKSKLKATLIWENDLNVCWLRVHFQMSSCCPFIFCCCGQIAKVFFWVSYHYCLFCYEQKKLKIYKHQDTGKHNKSTWCSNFLSKSNFYPDRENAKQNDQNKNIIFYKSSPSQQNLWPIFCLSSHHLMLLISSLYSTESLYSDYFI